MNKDYNQVLFVASQCDWHFLFCFCFVFVFMCCFYFCMKIWIYLYQLFPRSVWRADLLASCVGQWGSLGKPKRRYLQSRFAGLGWTLRILLGSPHYFQWARKRAFPWWWWRSHSSRSAWDSANILFHMSSAEMLPLYSVYFFSLKSWF